MSRVKTYLLSFTTLCLLLLVKKSNLKTLIRIPENDTKIPKLIDLHNKPKQKKFIIPKIIIKHRNQT